MAFERKVYKDKLTCSKCHRIKTVDSFYDRSDCLSGKNSWCKSCVKSTNNNRHEILSDADPIIVNGKRFCQVCQTGKPLSAFGKSRSGKFGRSYKCKPCKVKLETSSTRIYAANKPKYDTVDPYGLKQSDKQNMLNNQNGKCANKKCENEISVTRNDPNIAHVDHCHITNKVRELLCKRCNIALGLLKEDKNRIDGLSEYIQKHKET